MHLGIRAYFRRSLFISLCLGALATTFCQEPDSAGLGTPVQPAPAPEVKWPARILHVTVSGNKITKSRVIAGYCGLDSGMVINSRAIGDAERSLIASSLFRTAKVLSVPQPDGIDIYIAVTEYPMYFSFPPQLDLYHYYYRHSERGDWYCPVASIDLTNFGGRMEMVDLAAQAGAWSSYSLSWQKPLVPSRFFIGVGGSFSSTPDNFYDLDQKKWNGTLTLGRRFFDRSSAYVRFNPGVREVDKPGAVSRNTQIYSSVGWSTDFRTTTFDPTTGALLSAAATTNAIRPEPGINRYVQFSTDIKFYHPFILIPGDRFAYRLFTLFRNRDADSLNRVVTGGTGSVRGYYTDEIGQYASNGGALITENDELIFSWEYRFPIFQFPSCAELLPDKYVQMLGSLRVVAPRFDGALILDYGRVSPTPAELFRSSGSTACGTGIGFGLRIMEPNLRCSAALDFIWSTNPSTDASATHFEPRRLVNLYGGISF